MSAENTGGQTGLARMAKIAVLRRPGNIVVVAGTTELAIDDVGHCDRIPPRLHLESQFSMTDLAAEPDAVKPVGKDYRPHAIFLRLAIDHHISILSMPIGQVGKQE